MTQNETEPSPDHAEADAGYTPPSVTFLGTLAELTQKEVGAADGTTFLGLDIGPVS
jgi:hypothetical protein